MRAFARPDLRPYLPDLRFLRTVGRGACVLCTAGWAVVRRGARSVLGTPSKGATTADRAERAGQGVLVAVVAGAVGAGVVVAVYQHLVPYAPWAAAGGVLVFMVAALAVAPEEEPPAPAGEPAPEEVAGEPVMPRAGAARAALLHFLDVHTRGRNGIHLGELHEKLAQTAVYAALRRAEVGPLLDVHGVPTVRSLTVGGVSGRTGVRRADVLALLSPDPQTPPSAPSRLVSSFSDLGISRLTLDDSRPSESGSEST